MWLIAGARFALWLRKSMSLRASDPVLTARQVSMLHPDTLAMLYVLASRCKGAILEIGPYIGGSTLAIAAGNTRQKLHIAVEAGGSSQHPQLPSRDIVADLRANLGRAGFVDRVSIVTGHSRSDEVRKAVADRLRGQKVGLLCIDADGMVGETIDYYRQFLAYGCLIVLDDYEIAEEFNEKAGLVKKWVAEADEAGLVQTFAVLQWGTWFGRYVAR